MDNTVLDHLFLMQCLNSGLKIVYMSGLRQELIYPRSVVAWKAKFPGDVLRSYFILKASRMLQLKNGTQHSRKVAEMIKWKQSYWHNLNFFLMVRLSKNIQQLDAASKKVMVIYQSAHQKTKKSVGHSSNNSQTICLSPGGPHWNIMQKKCEKFCLR